MKCGRCQEACHGNVVTVQDKYFHQYCFSCIKCSSDLLNDGYFFVDGEVYCTNDYYALTNTERCGSCGKYVEGEVVTVLDSVFHPDCFGCQRCNKLFPAGANIIFDGDEFICEDCDYSNQRINQRPSNSINKINKYEKNNNSYFSPKSNDIDKHEYNPLLREEPPKRPQEPAYDYNPPLRQEPPKRSQESYHDYNPPLREEPPKRTQEPFHDYNPLLREESHRRPQEAYHDYNRPLREETPKRPQEAYHDYNPPLREEPPKRPQEAFHDYNPLLREEPPKRPQEPVHEERSRVAPPPYQQPAVTKQAVEEKSIAQSKKTSESVNNCAGCGNDIRSGQALLALEKQWHLWCFTCHKCGCLLAGEYMGRDGLPYCEDDYQREFGVTCAGCNGYITGKVLQAGEKHYHPQCSRCAKCMKIFGEGEEMYLQGSEIWHPQCSEEYRRELEEFADPSLENRKGPPSYENTGSTRLPSSQSYHDSSEPINNENDISRDLPPTRQPYSTSYSGVKPAVNGYDSHSRQFSTSSSEGTKNERTQEPATFVGGTWKPPGTQVASSKPAGFRSVKPPQPVTSSMDIKTTTPINDSRSDEEDAPPVPPPPTRGSSNAWKQKYTTSGVYTAKPFQKQSNPTNRRPLSFVESAARKEASSDNLMSTTANGPERYRTASGSASSGNDDESINRRDTGPSRPYQKGVGYNKLQLRKLQKQQQQQQQTPLSKQTNGYQQFTSDNDLSGHSGDDANKGNPKDKTSYLTDDEFLEVFNMTREKFGTLPKWRQEDMKRAKYLL